MNKTKASNGNTEHESFWVEKSLPKLKELIDQKQTVRQKIAELKEEIHVEILRDGVVYNPNFSFADNLEYHRQALRGHGQAQYLARGLPELEKQETEIRKELNQLLDAFQEPCDRLKEELIQKLKTGLAANRKAVIAAIRPLCGDDDEANERVESFDIVSAISDRLPMLFSFSREKPYDSASSLLREFRKPTRLL